MLLDLCLDAQAIKHTFVDMTVAETNNRGAIWVHEVSVKAIDYVQNMELADSSHGEDVIFIYDPEFEEAEKHLRRLLEQVKEKP